MNRRGILTALPKIAAVSSVFALRGDPASASPAGDARVSLPRSRAPFVSTEDGTALFYRDWGNGDAVLFLAPWGLHSDWWEYQMADLVEHQLRCVSYDRRGHGRSTEAVHGYEFDTLADDLSRVIEHLDLRRVTIVAQSIGCGEVVRYLARHGSRRVARLVLVAPITPLIVRSTENPEGVDPEFLEKVRQALRRDRASAIAGAAASFFGTPANEVSKEIMQWWTNMLLSCPLKVLIELQRVFTTTDFGANLRAVTVPTLIIQGDKDTSTPLDLTGRKTAAQIKGSELRVYEGAAHGLPISHMERLNSDVRKFLGR